MEVFDIQTVYLFLSELFEIELLWHLVVCKKSVLLLDWILLNRTVCLFDCVNKRLIFMTILENIKQMINSK